MFRSQTYRSNGFRAYVCSPQSFSNSVPVALRRFIAAVVSIAATAGFGDVRAHPIDPSGPGRGPVQIALSDLAPATDNSDPVEARAVRPRNPLSIYFEAGSADLDADGLVTIEQNASRLKSDEKLMVTLIGYTDDMGSTSYSIALANQRLSTVRDELLKNGVTPRQIHTAAYGQSEMERASCITELCRVSYRRVEFRYAKARAAASDNESDTNEKKRHGKKHR